jgi:plastocyanin
VNIRVGSTVIWENVDDEIHTATSGNITDGAPLFHQQLNPGDKFQFTFNKPGTYYFSCVIAFHEMPGTIRVHP